MRRNLAFTLIALAALPFGCAASRWSASPLKEVERIVFFGDSITQAGAEPGGYVSQIRDSLTSRYPDKQIQVIGEGISGNRVPDLQARFEEDVLAHDPTTVVIYIGINDVWHWTSYTFKGTTREEYEAGLRDMVGRLERQGTRVLLCTPSVIGEKHDGTNPEDAMLEEYAGISREVASDLGAEVCDLRQAFINHLRRHNTANAAEGVLTTDRVHLNAEGNTFVASQILAALERRR